MADIPYYDEVKPGQIFPPSKTITNFTVALVNDLITKINLIDPGDYQAEIDAILASLVVMQGEIDTAEADIDTIETTLVSLQDQIDNIETGEVFWYYTTIAAAEAATIPVDIDLVVISSYAVAGDNGEAIYKKVVAEPSHPGKFQSTDGAWWEITGNKFNLKQFGATGDGVTSDQTAVVNAVEVAAATGAELCFPPGTYLTTASIPDFHSVQKSGPGIVKRGATLFYISPTNTQTNNLYIATTGSDSNDGLTSSQPLLTIQPAFNIIKNLREPVYGLWDINLAAGTYTEGAFLTFIDPVDRRIRIKGPAVALNTTPTAIVDGTTASRDDGLYFENCKEIEVRDIKFINFASDDASAGVEAAETQLLRLINVHVADGGTGYYMRTNTVYFVTGGKIDNCSYTGILELYAVVRNMETVTSLADGLQITNCGYGIFAKEHCTGHFDWTTIDGCDYGIFFSRSCTANATNCKITNNGVGAVLRHGSYLVNLLIDWGAGTADANTKPWVVDHTSDFVTNEGGVEPDSSGLSGFTGMGERLAAAYVPNSPLTHTGTTSETDLITLCNMMAGAFTQRGSYYRMVVLGTKSGSAGTATLILRTSNNGPSVILPSGTTGYRAEMWLMSRGPSSQRTFSIASESGDDSSPVSVGDRTLAYEDGATTIKLRAALGSAADTILIDAIYVYTTEPLKDE